MNQVIEVINTIIENKINISNVINDNGMIFFLYKEIHIFSLHSKSDTDLDAFYFNVYPAKEFDINRILYLKHNVGLNEVPMVSFDSDDFKTQEALETFRDLYLVLKSKLYDVDKVFADILKGI